MMMKNRIYLLIALLTGILLVTACGPAKTPTPDANMMITQAAATVAAQLTQNAALTPSPTATLPATPTTPPLPTNTPAPVQAQPTAAVSPTVASGGQTTANNTGDGGSFVTDVTVPDGTVAIPGTSFTKTWRIKNTGTTTWDTAYSLVLIDGEKMGAPDNGIAMPKAVKPGEEVDISVKLTAPTKSGTYQSYFRLRNAGGQFFRLDGTGDLWVKIIVGGATLTPNAAETTAALTATPTP